MRAAPLTAEPRLQVPHEVIARTGHYEFVYGSVDSLVSALENPRGRVTQLWIGARSDQEIDQILLDHIRTMRIRLAVMHSPKPSEDASEDLRRSDELP